MDICTAFFLLKKAETLPRILSNMPKKDCLALIARFPELKASATICPKL